MPILATLIYCQQEDKVLLAQRNKDPFAGFWVAPGGKFEPQESPIACAERELREETGLVANQLQLRAIINEVSPRDDYQWLIFIFLATEFSAEVRSDEREGILRWWSAAELSTIKTPAADQIFTPRVLDLTTDLYQASYYYDDAINLIKVVEEA